MLEQYAAHLRFHWKITPRQWALDMYSEAEIIEWWYEFIFVKEQLGEITDSSKPKH